MNDNLIVQIYQDVCIIEGSSVSVKELESSEAKVRGEQAGHGDDSGDLHTYRAA